MINPIAQALSNTQSQNLANNISSFLKMTNPQAMLQQMMSKNDPRLGALMKVMQQNGGDPERAARQVLAERGIDADQLIKQLGEK